MKVEIVGNMDNKKQIVGDMVDIPVGHVALLMVVASIDEV